MDAVDERVIFQTHECMFHTGWNIKRMGRFEVSQLHAVSPCPDAPSSQHGCMIIEMRMLRYDRACILQIHLLNEHAIGSRVLPYGRLTHGACHALIHVGTQTIDGNPEYVTVSMSP